MIQKNCVICAALAVALSLLPSAAWGQEHETVLGQKVAAHEVLVKFRATAPVGAIAGAQQGADVDQAEVIGTARVLRLHSRTKDAATLATELSSDPNVLYAEPNFIVHTTLVPNDPSFGQLRGFQNTGQSILGQVGIPGADISAVSAWDISTGSTANVVGVIDTGIDYNHPDLAPNVWSAPVPFTVTIGTTQINCPAGSHGYNAINDSCDPLDDNNHGTHVSGTIGAVGNNSQGVVGVNWTASIMGLKFLDSSGSGTTTL